MCEVLPKARELADRALALDPESSDAHAALGNIAFQFDHDWPRAEAEFRQAIAINPSSLAALRFYGLMLLSVERFEEAKEVIRRAIRLDPGGSHQATLAWAELDSGNFERGLEYAEEVRDKDPTAIAGHTYCGLAYLQAGRRADATREAETSPAGANEAERFDHALLNALVGRPEPARAVIREVEGGQQKSYTSRTELAMLYAALGEKEKALALLEEDFREGEQVLWLWYRGVYFDSIRDDPRFITLLRQYGLPVHGFHRLTPSDA